MTEQIKILERSQRRSVRGVRTVENVRGAPKARADEGSGDMPSPPPPPRPRNVYFLGLRNVISHVFQGTVS